MGTPLEPAQTRPLVLAIAALQGLALYALHRAIDGNHWPASDLRWLAPLGLLATLLPVTAQLVAPRLHERAAWVLLGATAIALAYVGWHFGARLPESPYPPFRAGPAAPNVLALLVLWLLALPFLRLRLDSGHWTPDYAALFREAWRTVLTLLEAWVFTGVFWLLLFLWGRLFATLGIDFFAELFAMPLFAYPVTAIVFGTALHLVGSIDRLIDVALGQILGLFKWLAPLAGFIVAVFTLALLPRLPPLFVAGERAVSAAWLLWLLALTVLLLNAAYQDGRQASPYGRWLSLAMRAVPPLMLVIAVTALYALGVRVAQHGLTVSRYWGLVVAGTALAYAFAYAVAAIRRGPWLGGMGRSNVLIALALGLVLAASLTPVASPHRLSAWSQGARALAAAEPAQRELTLRYLRLELGGYGTAQLRDIAALRDQPGPGLRATAEAAQAVLDGAEDDLRRELRSARSDLYEQWLAASQRVPPDSLLPAGLDAVLRRDFTAGQAANGGALLLWLDLDADGNAELLVVESEQRRYRVYERAGAGWQRTREGRLGAPEDEGR